MVKSFSKPNKLRVKKRGSQGRRELFGLMSCFYSTLKNISATKGAATEFPPSNKGTPPTLLWTPPDPTAAKMCQTQNNKNTKPKNTNQKTSENTGLAPKKTWGPNGARPRLLLVSSLLSLPCVDWNSRSSSASDSHPQLSRKSNFQASLWTEWILEMVFSRSFYT